VKMNRCEDEQMWEKMWRWADVRADVREDVKMSRCENEKVWGKVWRWEGVKMRRCEDEKMRYRPPLLEEPCAQTLSGIKKVPNHQPVIQSTVQLIKTNLKRKCVWCQQLPALIITYAVAKTSTRLWWGRSLGPADYGGWLRNPAPVENHP